MLPEFFGIYLRGEEQLTELQSETVANGGIASLTTLAMSHSSPSFVLYHDQHSPHDLGLSHLNYAFRAETGGTWQPESSIPLKIAPEHVELHKKLALLYYRQQKYRTAIEGIPKSLNPGTGYAGDSEQTVSIIPIRRTGRNAKAELCLIARYYGFGVVFRFVLPVRARDWLMILGVIRRGLLRLA